MSQFIKIKGAREHNLKNISLSLPRDQFVVITGLSGSGKSSLVFDTIYAEGQRRYVESLSVYARQFLEQLKKPEVESIDGLSPAIAIEQRTAGKNPRSTVGTITEIYDYLRLLFARIGKPICSRCDEPISSQPASQIVQHLLEQGVGEKQIHILAPIVRERKGEYQKELRDLREKGFSRVEVDGVSIDLIQTIPKLDKMKQHSINVLIDRLVIKEGVAERLAEAVHIALGLAEQMVKGRILDQDGKTTEQTFNTRFSCFRCGVSFPEIEPRLFSFNTPSGACPTCLGTGSLALMEEERETQEEEELREEAENFSKVPCPTCHGKRLKKESLSVKIDGRSIADICELSLDLASDFFNKLQLTPREEKIAERMLYEIKTRLVFLKRLGLDYLTLDRSALTLAGGEVQRVRLATQIGSALTGVLYILDEPSIGLHPRDNSRLIDSLKQLRDMGNSILVVEHDALTIQSADYVVDMGPGGGTDGGHVVAKGPLRSFLNNKKSVTAPYLRGEKSIPVPKARRKAGEKVLTVTGARENNLKNMTIPFPLGLFICVTGVSGSGKSTLIMDTLYAALAQKLYKAKIPVGSYEKLEGIEFVDKVVHIDQNPIGRTPRSNPATYAGLFFHIRNLFAHLPEARLRGYMPTRFSFNVRGGRCENCEGEGALKIEMQLLPDVYVPCDVCRGMRYNAETLEILYKGKSIADLLQMTVTEALEFLKNISVVKEKLQVLFDVGLGYLTLGQPATTLSGGEAQRVKLSKELSRRSTGKTLYILDEPTTGLHFEDVSRFLSVLQKLVDLGNTVIVIEHNLEVIKSADYLIDLGPEGGAAGGELVAAGSPEEVARVEKSYTAQFLKPLLAGSL